MSTDLFRLARSRRILTGKLPSATDKIVILAMIKLADADGVCSASQADISKQFNIPDSTVNRSIHRMHQYGYITITKLAGQMIYKINRERLERSEVIE